MALTRITKGVIKPNENYDTHNINSTGIITATKFVGPVTGAITGTADLASGLTGTPSITVQDVVAVGATFTGNVSIGGTLTYEDVTNIDSVGLITARDGIDCNGDLDVDGHTNLDNVSVAGVSTFSGTSTFGGQLNIPDAIVHSGNDNAKIRFVDTDTVTVETAGSERLRIGSTGISTFTNDVRIVKSAGPLLELTTNTGAADATLRLSEGAVGSTSNGGGMFYSGADNKLYITCGTNSTTKRITIQRDDGKVGIGTVTPGKQLHVFKSNEHPVILERGDSSNTQIELRTGGAIRGYWGCSTTANFMVYDNDTSDINFTVLQTGNVGIGTDPSQKLEVLGSTILKETSSTGTALQIKGAGTQGDNALISFSNGYTQTFKIGMSDDIGPARDFIISETSTGASTDNENPKYTFNGNGDGIFSITDKAGGDVKVLLNSNGDSYFTGGNVAINKTSGISAKLHIGDSGNNGAASQLIKLANDSSNAGTGAQINMGAAHANESTSACIAGITDASGTAFIVKTAGTYGNQSTVAERFRIDSSGRLTLSDSEGIQLSAKTSTLYSADGTLSYYATDNGVYLNGAGANGWLRLQAAGSANDRTSINISGHSRTNGDEIYFKTNSAERLRINSDGRALFDRGAPASANKVIARFQCESSRKLDIVWHDSGSLMGFDTPGNHSYIFKCNNSERLRITSDGNLAQNGGSGLSYFKGSSEYIFGSNTSSPPSGGAEAKVQIHAAKTRAQFSINAYMNNAGGPFMQFVSSRSGTVGTLGTKCQSNDTLGEIRFMGDNATNYNSLCQGASIYAQAKSTPADGDTVIGGQLSFATGSGSAGSVNERFVVKSNGAILAIPRKGYFEGTYVYRQRNQSQNYEHRIRGPHGSFIELETYDNCNAEITVNTIGTSTRPCFCKYRFTKTDGTPGSGGLTHIAGGNGANSNVPYMVISSNEPRWKMNHAGGYYVIVRVVITGGDNGEHFTSTGEYFAN